MTVIYNKHAIYETIKYKDMDEKDGKDNTLISIKRNMDYPILILDKLDFRAKNITRDKCHFIIIKG